MRSPGVALALFVLSHIALSSAGELTPPVFRSVEVDTQVAIGYGVAVADVDGDRKPDILLADKKQLAWYRNPDWRKFVMAEDLTRLDNVCLAAADVDGDGKAEVAVGAGWNPNDTTNSGAVFYLAPPGDRTGRWEPRPLPHEPTVHRMRWTRDAAGQYHLVVVPLHGRGNQGTAGAGVRILAYRWPAEPTSPWKTELVNDSLHATHNLELVRWTAPAGDQLLVAAKEGVFHMREAGESWQSRQLPGIAVQSGAGEVRAGRLPGGRKFVVTIEPMHGSEMAVYTQPAGSEPYAPWRRHVLDDSLREGHALACGDILKAGFDQVLVGWRGSNRNGKVGIKLFWPVEPQGGKWAAAVVDDNTVACEDLCLADLDADGRLDIVAAGRSTHNLKVFFNTSLPR